MTQLRTAQAYPLGSGYFELRISLCNPAKLNELFGIILRDLPALHRKHQIVPIATWRSLPAAPQPLLACLFHWISLDDRLDMIRSFLADPGWLGSGKIDGDPLICETDVSILKCADEWPVSLQSVDGEKTEALHELRLYRLGVGGPDVGFAFLSNIEMRFMVDQGATVNGLCRMWLGDLPQAVALLRWPDYATRARAVQAYYSNRGLQQIQECQRTQFGATVVGRTHSYLLQALGSGLAIPTR
jgi:hypothetical protein